MRKAGKNILYFLLQDISITVKPKAAEKPPTNSGKLQNTTSDIDLRQLSFQINSLSIHSNQEDRNKVEKAKLLTMLDVQVGLQYCNIIAQIIFLCHLCLVVFHKSFLKSPCVFKSKIPKTPHYSSW